MFETFAAISKNKVISNSGIDNRMYGQRLKNHLIIIGELVIFRFFFTKYHKTTSNMANYFEFFFSRKFFRSSLSYHAMHCEKKIYI